MALLNGNITNDVLTSPQSFLLQEVAAAGRGDRVEQLFLAILTRKATPSEKSAATAGMRPDRAEDNKEMAEIKGLGNVVWALVNTREFMFIQ
ncbi:MAG: hypothetical protein KDM64_11465, partial [Verrucomicrobiae bacterium]|nr:hypothetical protein [Verrucomicrobiae bacterium]